MYTELDYLPDVKASLRYLIRDCQDHIKNNTFDEKTFQNCFNYFFRYTNILLMYQVHDDLDTFPMREIQNYYNDKSTMYIYDIDKKTRKDKEIIYSIKKSSKTSRKIWDFIDEHENIIIFGGLLLFLYFLLHSCAHGETLDEALNKYVLVNPNDGKVIEFFDESYEVNREIEESELFIHKSK